MFTLLGLRPHKDPLEEVQLAGGTTTIAVYYY